MWALPRNRSHRCCAFFFNPTLLFCAVRVSLCLCHVVSCRVGSGRFASCICRVRWACRYGYSSPWSRRHLRSPRKCWGRGKHSFPKLSCGLVLQWRAAINSTPCISRCVKTDSDYVQADFCGYFEVFRCRHVFFACSSMYRFAVGRGAVAPDLADRHISLLLDMCAKSCRG